MPKAKKTNKHLSPRPSFTPINLETSSATTTYTVPTKRLTGTYRPSFSQANHFRRRLFPYKKDGLDLGIEVLTSDIDDTYSTTSKTEQQQQDEPASPSINLNNLQNPLAAVKKDEDRQWRQKSHQQKHKDDNEGKYYQLKSKSKNTKDNERQMRRISLGNERRWDLSNRIERYKNNMVQQTNSLDVYDIKENAEKRKQYFNEIWYELQVYIHGINTLDKQGIEKEKQRIDSERQQGLDEFFHAFLKYEFKHNHLDTKSLPRTTVRKHLSDEHLHHCSDVDHQLKFLFIKWEKILYLFPSTAELELYDNRFNSKTHHGKIFYEKLAVFQAWYNLHSEINRLIIVLGRIMSCSQCNLWPHVECSAAPKLHENSTLFASRPPTPTSFASASLDNHSYRDVSPEEKSPSSSHPPPFHLQPHSSNFHSPIPIGSAILPPTPGSYLLNNPPSSAFYRQQLSTLSNVSAVSYTSTSSTSLSFSTPPSASILHSRRQRISSSHSVELTQSSSLTDYYYRYMADQLTHARVELIASIFQTKHGSLLQRLHYTFRKQQPSSKTTENSSSTSDTTAALSIMTPFGDTIKQNTWQQLLMPSLAFSMSTNQNNKLFSNDYMLNAKPEKLMNEFFILNRQLRRKQDKKQTTNLTTAIINVDKRTQNVTNIMGRLERTPTITTSTFQPASAPTLVQKMLANDRTVIKRQNYFLDYLNSSLYAHLPGSALFPDPCSFLNNIQYTSISSQLSRDEISIIIKLIQICYRLHSHVWLDYDKFHDYTEIFHLPTLYPQYIFLAFIPFDLMFSWHQYHNDRKFDITNRQPTTGAILLLIDECKILIHSSVLIRQYFMTMIHDILEKPELAQLEQEIVKFDQHIIATIHEFVKYVEKYVEITLKSNLFSSIVCMLKDQWKYIKRYATVLNEEEYVGEKFLLMWSQFISKFKDYIQIFHPSSPMDLPVDMPVEFIRKKINKKYNKKLTMAILRETKQIYDDCAMTLNIYLQKPICKRFLTILKTARFERIKYEPFDESIKPNDKNSHSKCLLFASSEYFEDNQSKIQLFKTLSSSFRLESTIESATPVSTTTKLSDEQQQLNESLQSKNRSSVYILCVPVPDELAGEWRGVEHTVSTFFNVFLTSIKPLYLNWKTTSMFLLTQQTQQLDEFLKMFHTKLENLHLSQNDLLQLDRTQQQKRSCFEKIDHAMYELNHAVLNLSENICTDIDQFELLLENLTKEKSDDEKRDIYRTFLHTEERLFAFAMDVVRETSYFASQLDQNSVILQAQRQINLASNWLKFVYKKSTGQGNTLPVWSMPGITFLKHACDINYSKHIDEQTFGRFYQNMQNAIVYLLGDHHHGDGGGYHSSLSHVSSTFPTANIIDGNDKHENPFKTSAPPRKNSLPKAKKTRAPLTIVEKLDNMDRTIDRKRLNDGLIGQIKQADNRSRMSLIPAKVQEDLARLKIRNWHKLSLLARGQFATSYMCRTDTGEVLCYKQYRIQPNDAQAIGKVLEQLIPLVHIQHENLIRYRGIALDQDHILFFMEYCSFGTVAQLLIGSKVESSAATATVPTKDGRTRSSTSTVTTTSDSDLNIAITPTHRRLPYNENPNNVKLTCSIAEDDINSKLIDDGIYSTQNGYAFLDEKLVQIYVKQLLSALSCLHDQGIIHRDIRCVNIFLTDTTKRHIKLGDLNFVYDFKFMKRNQHQQMSDVEEVISMRESIAFMSPETITQNETTTKSDIWSLGCTLIHMLTGRIPWSNYTVASNVYYLNVKYRIAYGDKPQIPGHLSENCVDFLEKCFIHDPNKRPSCSELEKHPFVTEAKE